MQFKWGDLFRKQQPKQTPPEGLGVQAIEIEHSICTGEAVIGFRDPSTGKLQQAVAARSDKDIETYYRAYGFEPPTK